MFKFTKTKVILIISVLIFILIQIFIDSYVQKIFSTSENYTEIMKLQIENLNQEKEETKVNLWEIEIPSISLVAQIAEGTNAETLNKYVGHFENTSKQEGNICLAAHNRGYEVNYFKDLKLLKEGDEIKYRYNTFEKTYEVTKCRIIKDTDWQYLEETEDNMLTLITCVENEPEYRRCIQAIEKEEL